MDAAAAIMKSRVSPHLEDANGTSGSLWLACGGWGIEALSLSTIGEIRRVLGHSLPRVITHSADMAMTGTHGTCNTKYSSVSAIGVVAYMNHDPCHETGHGNKVD